MHGWGMIYFVSEILRYEQQDRTARARQKTLRTGTTGHLYIETGKLALAGFPIREWVCALRTTAVTSVQRLPKLSSFFFVNIKPDVQNMWLVLVGVLSVCCRYRALTICAITVSVTAD